MAHLNSNTCFRGTRQDGFTLVDLFGMRDEMVIIDPTGLGTQIAGSVFPFTDDALDIGSATKRYRNLYLSRSLKLVGLAQGLVEWGAHNFISTNTTDNGLSYVNDNGVPVWSIFRNVAGGYPGDIAASKAAFLNTAAAAISPTWLYFATINNTAGAESGYFDFRFMTAGGALQSALNIGDAGWAAGLGKSYWIAAKSDLVSINKKIVIADSNADNEINIGRDGSGNLYIDGSRTNRSITISMGSGTGQATVGGAANVNTTAANNVGAGETTLISYVLPANSLSVNGKGVRVTAWGFTANNANAKTLRAYFGATQILLRALTASQISYWKIVLEIYRTGASAEACVATIMQGGATNFVDANVPAAAIALNANVTISITGQATSNGDITQAGMTTEILN